MDKSLQETLLQGARRLGVELSPAALAGFSTYLEELLRWSGKVNLTAVKDPAEVIEKHFLDSLAVVPLAGATLLDVGTGAGFPGMVVKLARPEVRVTMVDGVAKKVAFLKALMARLGTAGAEARALRVEGQPESEGLGQYETVVSRAVESVDEWLPRAVPYVAPGGRAIAMLGKAPPEAELADAGRMAGLELEKVVPYRLEPSLAERSLAVYRKR